MAGRVPDTRARSPVETIREQLREALALALKGPGAEPEPGRPVQLVRLDEEGGLTLDEGALSRCLEQGGVGGAPVCLVSVIGEQRRGKSFLLNYLLRRLRSPDVRNRSWMGREEEPLKGFEWRADEEQVTKGVWAWSQPFWVPAKGGQVAVLLVDTEGSMDVERNKETSVKLCALSMLLSSYQILNIGCRVKDPDLEYLEMFLQVAEVVGKEYGLEPVQHLDLLVRDWTSSLALGAGGGEKHLRNVRQGLAATSPCKHPKALAVLGRSSSRCYLMPFPGKGIMTGSEGALRDMDEDFRESLRDYVTALVGSARTHVRRDRQGEPLTGAQLSARIKNLSHVMRTHRSGFSSPCQMIVTFHNQRTMDRAHADHTAFLREKDALSRHMDDCLQVDPGTMAQQLEKQRRAVLGSCLKEMKEPEEALLTALEQELAREAETFLQTYCERHQQHINTANKRAMDRTRAAHAKFLEQKDNDSQNPIKCLWVKPSKMKKQLEKQHEQLLERCRSDMYGPAVEKEAPLEELEAELKRKTEPFRETYGKRFTRFAVGAGVAAGVLVLAPVGGAVGAGIAAAAIATEAAIALGVVGSAAAGAAAGAATGVVVGGGVAGNFARKDKKRARTTSGQSDEGDGAEDASDKHPLI